MYNFFKLIILILGIIVVAVFSSYNDQAVSVNLFPFDIQFEISLFIVVFSCIVFGVLLSGIGTSLRLIYWKRVAKSTQKKLEKLQDEQKKVRKSAELTKHEA